jgi:nicotinate-nucleotide pyrophosphorylase (carboxylating)
MDPVTLKLQAGPLIEQALREDLNGEDVSTMSVAPEWRPATVELICKQDGIIAGLDVFDYTFRLLDEHTACTFDVDDGAEVHAGQMLGRVDGDVRVLLSGERTALNYLQRMSGIATYTRRIVSLLAGSHTTLVDTRKTTPNMRIFEKEATRIGGAANHRYNLTSGVMLKDNHIAAAGGIAQAVAAARARAPFVLKIEVEVENLDMVQQALDAGADIIMLDNMTHAEMAEAVHLIDGHALTECSGNITADNAAAIADLGIDFVSSGALTHSAPILDLSLKHLQILDAE